MAALAALSMTWEERMSLIARPHHAPVGRPGRSMLAVLGAATLAVVAAGPALAQDAPTETIPPADLSSAIAPFVFSHETAIAKGATAEWRKMEGVAMDPTSNTLYVAVTAVAKGMSDGEGDIQLAENLCGAVFGGALDAGFDLASLSQVIVGGPYDETDADYPCDPDAIASPDNVVVDPSGNLWIGEDTDFHHNQMLWMWDGTTLKRFATMPEGAEVTGLRVGPDGTLFLNIQHPAATNLHPWNRGTVGVITGFKAGDAFEPVPVPEGDAMKQLVVAAGEYQVLARAGEAIPGMATAAVFGEIPTADATTLPVCNNPDGNMYLPTASDGTQGYLYTNWECVPGGVSKLYIRQGADGSWATTDGDLVDFTTIGTQNNCAASVTPWNTGLTSEEYPPDVQDEYDAWVETRDLLAAQVGHAPDPLQYGYIVELTPAGGEEGGLNTIARKHYAMGRFSHEMALVMPDGKTAYSGDDGTDRVLYKFVADTAGDLSAGTLYAARIVQDGDTLGTTWIALGSGNDADIEAALEAMSQA